MAFGKQFAPTVQRALAPLRRRVSLVGRSGGLNHASSPVHFYGGFFAPVVYVEQVAEPPYRSTCVGANAIVHACPLFAHLLGAGEEPYVRVFEQRDRWRLRRPVAELVQD